MTVTIGRRELLAALGGAATAWPFAARAQQPKMPRLGFVGIQPRDAPIYTNFLRRMAELGYQEGRNFTFDYIQTPNVEGYERHYRTLAAARSTCSSPSAMSRRCAPRLRRRAASRSRFWQSISTRRRRAMSPRSRAPG